MVSAAITSVVRAQQLFLGRIDSVLRPLGLTFARYEVLMLLLFSRRALCRSTRSAPASRSTRPV